MSAKRSGRGKCFPATEIAEQAATWLARRDRGLTPTEQDAYIQWLSADRRHAEALAQHAAALERMMKLYEWQPGHSSDANPDLFAPRRARAGARWRWGLSLAAAAAVVVSGVLWWHGKPADAPATQRTFVRVSESEVLPDGSFVELKDGSKLAVEFTDAERRVHLTGEAHFSVAKDPVPFIVTIGRIDVRAVGTAFNVRAEPDLVDVVVVEGSVEVVRAAHGGPAPPGGGKSGATPGTIPVGHGPVEPALPPRSDSSRTLLVAGQRAVVPLAPAAALRVRNVTTEAIAAALDWKAPRLQFHETPLAVAVEEFNRWNDVRLVIDHRELGSIPIGGTFRIDNVESFVHLLEITLDVGIARKGNEIVLTRRR